MVTDRLTGDVPEVMFSTRPDVPEWVTVPVLWGTCSGDAGDLEERSTIVIG